MTYAYQSVLQPPNKLVNSLLSIDVSKINIGMKKNSSNEILCPEKKHIVNIAVEDQVHLLELEMSQCELPQLYAVYSKLIYDQKQFIFMFLMLLIKKKNKNKIRA